MPNEITESGFMDFKEANDLAGISLALRQIVMEYMNQRIDTGYPTNFVNHLPGIMALCELLEDE